MYFPYLYARRAELLALRDISEELDVRDTVIPILEPVKADSKDLIRCLEVLGEASIRTLVITNPKQGDFKAKTTRPATLVPPWRSSLSESFSEYPSNIPAFVCRAETRFVEITSFLARYPNRDVALVYWSPRFSDAEIQSLIAERRIRFHVNLHKKLSTAQRALLPIAKAVDVVDGFNAQLRNADYGEPELLSDAHLTYSATSIGYGDYSVIGAKFSDSGGPAHAVAIHAVYKDAATGIVWVQHFVSDDTDINVGSTAGKYLQAATKLVRAATRRRREFGDNQALRGYAEDVATNNNPGLMTNKRRQIHHHVALNHSILRGTA